MYTHRIFPSTLPPDQLDLVLSHGWYRMGQSVFTCRFVIFGGQLYTALWTRLKLAGYTPRRSLRRLMRRNQSRFAITIGKASLTMAKEALYQRYRAHFPGELANSLVDSLHEESSTDVFDTWQVEVRDGDRLVAFSFFDRGQESLASIVGVYDPDYARYSLGFHTMLVEIEYGVASGYQLYYPGYVVPRYPALDYKLRAGELDYYDHRRRTWHPVAEVDRTRLSAELLQSRLSELQNELRRCGHAHLLQLYPPYELRALGADFRDYLPTPLFVECDLGGASESPLVVVYDVDRERYLLLRCIRMGDVSEHFATFAEFEQAGTCCLDLMRIDDVLVSTPSASEVADALTSAS